MENMNINANLSMDFPFPKNDFLVLKEAVRRVATAVGVTAASVAATTI